MPDESAGTEVWDRRAADDANEISPGAYNLVIGLCLLWGFLVTLAIVDTVPVETVRPLGAWGVAAGIASAFVGAWLFHHSARPWVSFLGHNLVLIPLGLLVDLAIYNVNPAVVMHAIRATALVTLIMMALATLLPGWFRAIAGTIAIALVGVVLVEVTEIFVMGVHHDILDWIVAAVFCGYIGLDWARANAVPRTLNNAIDCAAEIYVDVVVLFLRALHMLGRRG